MQVLILGRAPRTKETLPDFLKWRRVTRPPLVFRGLTGSQRTPGFWGVTGRPRGTGQAPPTIDQPPAFDQRASGEAVGVVEAAIAQARIAGSQENPSNTRGLGSIILRHS